MPRLVHSLGAWCALGLAAAPIASGSFEKAEGTANRSGPGTLYRYVVKVERGLDVDHEQFAEDVRQTLYDRRGWTRTERVAFKWVTRRADTKILLAKPATVDRLCSPLPTEGYQSCRIDERVVINSERWRTATPSWPKSLKTYRRMAVNHEVGHRLGQAHRDCAGSGQPAPVMQQQTIGLQGCAVNSWPLDHEIETLAP